jgi:hypothetical protein
MCREVLYAKQNICVLLVVMALLARPAVATTSIGVTVFPASQTVVAGETTAFVVSVSAPIGWMVNLTAVIPPQWSYTVEPRLIQHLERAILLITVNLDAKAGTYNVVVKGRCGEEGAESVVRVTVTARGRLTASIEPRILTVGSNMTISISVNPPVACTVTIHGDGLNKVLYLERGKGQVAVILKKTGILLILIEARGYYAYVEALPVEPPKTIITNASPTGLTNATSVLPALSYVFMVGGATIVLAVIVVLIKMERQRKPREGGTSRVGRHPPPPPALPPDQGVSCPTCQTLTNTRYCPKCGTRVRP